MNLTIINENMADKLKKGEKYTITFFPHALPFYIIIFYEDQFYRFFISNDFIEQCNNARLPLIDNLKDKLKNYKPKGLRKKILYLWRSLNESI